RPSTPMVAPKAPASRSARETPRSSPTVIGLNSSPGSALPSAEAPRVDAPATVQLWPLAPQPGQTALAESPRPASQPAETVAPSGAAGNPAPQASPAPDSTAKSSAP